MFALDAAHHLPIPLGFVALSGLELASAALLGPTSVRRALSLGVAALAFVVPFASDHRVPFFVVLLTMGALLGVLKSIDLASRDPLPFAARAAEYFFPFEVHARRPAARAFDGGALRRAAVLACLAALGYSGVVASSHLDEPVARWIVARLAVVVFVYGTVDAATGLLDLGARALGTRLLPLHRNPILSRSLAEFWAKRWNLFIHRWLERHAFRPLARRKHPRAGVALAFVLSAALHVAILVFVVSARDLVTTALFFLSQGALVVVESPLRVSLWRPWLARAWTALAILLPSPLFTGPLVHVLLP